MDRRQPHNIVTDAAKDREDSHETGFVGAWAGPAPRGFQEKADNSMMYGKLRLGGSDILLGTFQKVKELGVLVDWANTSYRPWYFDKVVKP